MIVLRLSKTLGKGFWGAEVFDCYFVITLCRALVRSVLGIALLDNRCRGTQSVESEELMGNMVMEATLAEEDVVFLEHRLLACVAIYCKGVFTSWFS